MKILVNGRELKNGLDVARRFTEPDVDRYAAIHLQPGPDDRSVRLMAANGFAVMVAELDATLRRDGIEQLSFDAAVLPRAELSSLDYPDLARFVAEAQDNPDTVRAWVHADLFCAAVQGMATIAGLFRWIGLRLDRRGLQLMVYRNDRDGPFFAARMPLAPRPDGEEYSGEVAVVTVDHEFLTKALKGFRDAEHVEISIPRGRAPTMVRSRALSVVIMPADIRPDYWTDVSYRNKVSYGNYCNEEMAATVQVEPGDDPADAAALARKVVAQSLRESAAVRAERQRQEEEEAERERLVAGRERLAALRARGWSDQEIDDRGYGYLLLEEVEERSNDDPPEGAQ